MSVRHRLIPSTHGARRRALILVLYLVILGAAVYVQAFQNRGDTVILYVQGNVAYAKALGEDLARPLFPLVEECDLAWMTQTQRGFVAHDQIAMPLANTYSLAGLHFSTIGDIVVLQGAPWVTIRSKLGDVQVKADCPPPPPTTHHIYVYVHANDLFVYDTLDDSHKLLMPLEEQLLWVGDETGTFTMEALVIRDEDKQGYGWLSEGSVVLGDFETASDIVVNKLDEAHVQILYGDHELMLLSHDNGKNGVQTIELQEEGRQGCGH